LELTIEKLVYGGDGLARTPADAQGRGKAVFVPFVLPGERVEASLAEDKPGFARAQLDAVLQSSPDRIQPKCPYFQRCGGCHYQHTGYERQLEIKANILKENLRRIAKLELEVQLQLHASPPWNYRNRTRLKVQFAPEFAIGYYKFESHDLLPVEQCPISSPLINQLIAALWDFGREHAPPAGIQEIEIFANADDSAALLETYCSPEAELDLIQSWGQELQRRHPAVAGCVAFQSKAGHPAMERIAAASVQDFTYVCNSAAYRVSAGAFFQVNRFLIDELVQIAIGGVSGTAALDFYAGVGLFSTVLARSFSQVIAVESSPISHADLRYNSPPNVKAVRAMTEQYLEKTPAKMRPELVVVDPPRGGLGQRVVRHLTKLSAPRLVYVSCDPATLSRDLRDMLALGYRIEQAHLVDLFPQTYHLESVFHLAR
jgi:23S rRNA (uracil1939-C5)-methyltransferase